MKGRVGRMFLRWSVFFQLHTQSNIAPEKWWLEDDLFLLGWSFFQGLCQTSGVRIPMYSSSPATPAESWIRYMASWPSRMFPFFFEHAGGDFTNGILWMEKWPLVGGWWLFLFFWEYWIINPKVITSGSFYGFSRMPLNQQPTNQQQQAADNGVARDELSKEIRGLFPIVQSGSNNSQQIPYLNDWRICTSLPTCCLKNMINTYIVYKSFLLSCHLGMVLRLWILI